MCRRVSKCTTQQDKFVAAAVWVEEFQKTHLPLRPAVYNYLKSVHVLFEGQIECKLNPTEDHLLVTSTRHSHAIIGMICVTDDNSIIDTSAILQREQCNHWPEVSRTTLESTTGGLA